MNNENFSSEHSLFVTCTDVTPVSDPLGADSGLESVTSAGEQDSSLFVNTVPPRNATALADGCSSVSHQQSPSLDPFRVRDPDLVHRGRLVPDLAGDWEHVQRVRLREVDENFVNANLWEVSSNPALEQEFPFHVTDDMSSVLDVAPKQLHKVGMLKNLIVQMPCGNNFTDKVLPASESNLETNLHFSPDYFVALHNVVSAPGWSGDGVPYPAYTPNHLGARVQLPHVKLKIARWRYHLLGYENAELVQHLEFGFPMGLDVSPDLKSARQNHGSAYQWYGHVDKFVSTETSVGGLTGPFKLAPWWNMMISPIMTAPKKPMSRRTVYDATFGEKSLNNATPSDVYMGKPTHYTFPKIEVDVSCGKGTWPVSSSSCPLTR